MCIKISTKHVCTDNRSSKDNIRPNQGLHNACETFIYFDVSAVELSVDHNYQEYKCDSYYNSAAYS